MEAVLEVWTPAGVRATGLDGARVVIGQSPQSDLALPFDPSVSRSHAVLEDFAGSWTIRDLGSRNGTYVNTERIVGDRALHDGDEIRIGAVRIVFRSPVTRHQTATEEIQPPPILTNRERDVLRELCRPLLLGGLLEEPATVSEIASCLVVSESAVKKHLAHLYAKFQLYDSLRTRSRLAHHAIRRGAITRAQLTTPS
jgi:FHA domain